MWKYEQMGTTTKSLKLFWPLKAWKSEYRLNIAWLKQKLYLKRIHLKRLVIAALCYNKKKERRRWSSWRMARQAFFSFFFFNIIVGSGYLLDIYKMIKLKYECSEKLHDKAFFSFIWLLNKWIFHAKKGYVCIQSKL
jgi:hypothetical protein